MFKLHKPFIECFHSPGQHLCKFVRTKESICIRKKYNSGSPRELVWDTNMAAVSLFWDTNMAAVSLFWDTNMAAVMSCENTLLTLKQVASTTPITDTPFYKLVICLISKFSYSLPFVLGVLLKWSDAA